MVSHSLGTKFLDDIERLQQINRTRNAPVEAQIKRVVDLLRQKRQALDPQQINQACYVDLNSNKQVFNSLKMNPKLHFDGVRFSYKPTYSVTNGDELFELVKKFPDGISVIDLKDAYPKATEDLASLKVAGRIWLISDVAYPIDPKFATTGVVDDDLKELYRGIKLPDEMTDIEKYLIEYGMKPATNTSRRMAMAHTHCGMELKPKVLKKKKFMMTKRTKLTNIHLPELFSS